MNGCRMTWSCGGWRRAPRRPLWLRSRGWPRTITNVQICSVRSRSTLTFAILLSRVTPPPPPFEVADLVREYGEAVQATPHVSHEQARVRRAIAQWRTAALGGQVEACEAGARSGFVTTPVVIGTAPRATAPPGPRGSPPSQPCCCRCPPATLSAPSPISGSPSSPSTNAPSITSCSRLPRRPSPGVCP